MKALSAQQAGVIKAKQYKFSFGIGNEKGEHKQNEKEELLQVLKTESDVIKANELESL